MVMSLAERQEVEFDTCTAVISRTGSVFSVTEGRSLTSPLWIGTSRSRVFWERWGQMTLISFCRSRSIWFLSSPPGNPQQRRHRDIKMILFFFFNTLRQVLALRTNLWLSSPPERCEWEPWAWRWSGRTCRRPPACSSGPTSGGSSRSVS